jgi:glucose/arabinose dehydrogenase
MVVSGLDRPSALATLPDGRLLIAERGGRIRVADAGVLLATPAAELADADAGGDEGVSLAVAPGFEATRHVFVSYVSRDTGGARVGRVVRLRVAGGTLGERAVLLDGLPAHDGTAPRIRFGPDGALYVGTTAVDTRDADDLGSYAGKILRFTATGGAAPGSAIGGSPIISFGHRGPRLDFDWEPVTQGLWSVEAGQRGLLLRRSGPGGSSGGRSAFLEGIQAAGSAFHAGATPTAWRNSLFLASPEDECLFRVSGLASATPAPAVERLLAGSFGRITAVLSAADGLYFATGGGDVDDGGQPAGAVFKISDR